MLLTCGLGLGVGTGWMANADAQGPAVQPPAKANPADEVKRYIAYADAGSWAIYPAMNPKVDYDPLKDFAPIGLFAQSGGLFLVVNVARTLGGKVSARNRPEGGAEVTLTLPLASIILEEEEDEGNGS